MNTFHCQNGFVLAATLWILAAITLAAAFFAAWTQDALLLARQSQGELQGEIDVTSTRSLVLYLLATQRMTLAGLTVPGTESEEQETIPNPLEDSVMPVGGEIAMDDRIYEGVGKARFSIQDEGGLLGLNNFSPAQLENLLGLLDVPSAHRGPLTDKLLDYTDTDDLYRLNGAEAEHYKNQGLPPPPNRWLLTSWEARNVLGWNDWPGLWKNQVFPRLTCVTAGGMPNFNTAPKLILKTIGGIDDEGADRIIEAREISPFSRAGDISEVLGQPLLLDPLGLTFFPSEYLRLTLWYEGGTRMREIHLHLTPRADKKSPWLTEYELSVPMPRDRTEAICRIKLPGIEEDI